jgi:membrane protease YdiL (CAAX protease family)
MLEAPRGALFYTAWEFFYRGFMLFGLRRYVGDWLAICIQTIPQCLWHIGMPTGEILSSIAGGILFGIMALRTRSILWPMLLHFSIGVFLDLFIVLRT